MVGGTVWLALVAAGIAAEVAYPAAIVRFGDATMTEFTQPLLTLSTWLYHYCQLGAAALIFATSTVIWRTGALLRLWIPLPAALSTLAWIAAISLTLLVLQPKLPAAAG